MSEDYQQLNISVPKPKKTFCGYDQWGALEGLKRVGSDQKVFIRGFVAALQLNDGQREMLLLEYAKRYRQALSRTDEDNPRRDTIASVAANSWIREGARGFVKRE